MNAVYCGMNSCLKNYLSILHDWQGKSKIISKNMAETQACNVRLKRVINSVQSILIVFCYNLICQKSCPLFVTVLKERIEIAQISWLNVQTMLVCMSEWKRQAFYSKNGSLTGKICRNRFESHSWKILFLNGASVVSLKIVKGKNVLAGTLVRQKYSR